MDTSSEKRSENESNIGENQTKKINLESEAISPKNEANSSDECTESEKETAFNQYIVQEITVIGDKSTESCPTTDTINERILVIDSEQHLNKLIESLSKPLNDVLFMTIKSDECINYDHEPDTLNKCGSIEELPIINSELDAADNIQAEYITTGIDEQNESKLK